MTPSSATAADLGHWLREFARLVGEQEELLTRLDSAIGDADHGTIMDRGMTAVSAALDGGSPSSPATLLKTVGMTLVSTVGGASGPLYGTLFLRSSAAGDAPTLDGLALAVALRAGLDGVMAQGKAAPGDKTMVDATIAMLARRGRASYLGERSIGHQDPGATSVALLITAAAAALGQD